VYAVSSPGGIGSVRFIKVTIVTVTTDTWPTGVMLYSDYGVGVHVACMIEFEMNQAAVIHESLCITALFTRDNIMLSA